MISFAGTANWEELLTLGSDAHAPEDIGYDFLAVSDYLRTVGYRYVMEFEGKRPFFVQL